MVEQRLELAFRWCAQDAPEIPGFRSSRVLPLPGAIHTDPPVCMIEFDVVAFRTEAFTLCGIACPPSVARSVAKRQAEFLFGRLAARQALALAGRATVDIPIDAWRGPMWPDGLIGSISHTSSIAVAVALRSGGRSGVGIDIETVVSDTPRRALLDTAFGEDELDCLRGVALPLNTAVTVAFSAKESIFKAVFARAGTYLDFASARLSGFDPVARELVFEFQQDICAGLLRGSACRLNYRLLDPSTVLTACLC